MSLYDSDSEARPTPVSSSNTNSLIYDSDDPDSIGIDALQDSNGDEPDSDPDLSLISELLENIERNPQAQEPRVLLMQHYALCGWHKEAKEEAHRILKIDGSIKEAKRYLENTRKLNRQGKYDSRDMKKGLKSSGYTNKPRRSRGNCSDSQKQRAQAATWQPRPVRIDDPVVSMRQLEDGYAALLKDAGHVLSDMKLLRDLDSRVCEDQIADLTMITNGQVSGVVMIKPLEGVKVVVEAIVSDSRKGWQKGLSAAMKDLEELTRWLKKSKPTEEYRAQGKGKPVVDDNQDDIREALVKRVKALKSLLPENLLPVADLAMMHADHEILHRKYVNDETFVSFDPISEIPRENFWASEDGYAWDMEELTGAIESGKGVMRNPLNKQMFSRADIRAILQHPLGKKLQILRVEQSMLKQGVRRRTIDEIDTLAKVLLADMSEDGKPSHLAAEIFVSYLETLPRDEQIAIDNLKVPAKDSHTGLPFDSTIGETVKDIQGNRLCNHKAGDFLAQVVKFLK